MPDIRDIEKYRACEAFSREGVFHYLQSDRTLLFRPSFDADFDKLS